MIAAKTVQATRSDVKTGPMYCDQWRRRRVAEGIFPLIVFITQGGGELVEAGSHRWLMMIVSNRDGGKSGSKLIATRPAD